MASVQPASFATTGPSLYRLLYCSRIQPYRYDQELEGHIEVILRYSHFKNPALGITGALLTNRKRFSQVIEGPEIAVKNLFGHISCDPRHRDVQLISHHPVSSRVFQEWHMAFVEPTRTFAAEHQLFPAQNTQFDLLATSTYCATVRRLLLANASA